MQDEHLLNVIRQFQFEYFLIQIFHVKVDLNGFFDILIVKQNLISYSIAICVWKKCNYLIKRLLVIFVNPFDKTSWQTVIKWSKWS